MWKRSCTSLTIATPIVALVAGALTTPAARAADESQKGTIQVEYETPKGPAAGSAVRFDAIAVTPLAPE